jgi:lipid II:glycine glycyltransferase (peptidoglycan interpeptide bridge formation enzyme)
MEIKSLWRPRSVSLPFSDYCDPLSTNELDDMAVIDYLKGFGRAAGWHFFELRLKSKFINRPETIKYHCHELYLAKDEKEIQSALRDSTRRNIAKARKQGVRITIGRSMDDLRKYYRVHCLTRKFHGLPPQPFCFFANIYKYVLSQNLGIIVLASYKDQCIAGNVFFHFGDNVYYKFGASDRAFQHLRASNLVMWEAIRHYCHHGYSTLCFGRTDWEDTGLLQYKDGWGAERREINYLVYDIKHDHFKTEKKMPHHKTAGLLKHAPIPLLKCAGALLYRYMG